MAKKTLRRMLEKYTASSDVDGSTKRLATFLAYWDEIEEAYQQGWSWHQIHDALFQEGVIDYSYSTFLYYKDKRQRREMEAVKQSVVRSADGAKSVPARRSSGKPDSMKDGIPVFKDVSNVKRF